MIRGFRFAVLGSFLLLAGKVSATTIFATGGSGGRTFVAYDGPLSPTNSIVQVGTFDGVNFSSFVPFAGADATPITFGTTASLLGKWQGNAADNSAGATAFNGQQVWFKITAGIIGGYVTNHFLTGGQLFPTNGGGVGDTLNISSQSLTTIVSFQLEGETYIDAPGNRIFLAVVPEPSALALGVLGGLLALRRRRD